MFITSAIEEIILRASAAGATAGDINWISKACNLDGIPLRYFVEVLRVPAGRGNRGHESKTMAPARSYLCGDKSEISATKSKMRCPHNSIREDMRGPRSANPPRSLDMRLNPSIWTVQLSQSDCLIYRKRLLQVLMVEVGKLTVRQRCANMLAMAPSLILSVKLLRRCLNSRIEAA